MNLWIDQLIFFLHFQQEMKLVIINHQSDVLDSIQPCVSWLTGASAGSGLRITPSNAGPRALAWASFKQEMDICLRFLFSRNGADD